MGRPGEFTRSEIKLLRWLRAHGPAGIGEAAAAVGEPTTNFGRQRLGEVEAQLDHLREHGLVDEASDERFLISGWGRRLLAEIAIARRPRRWFR
jgi:DNA-binding transcriptional ArsR family regulator